MENFLPRGEREEEEDLVSSSECISCPGAATRGVTTRGKSGCGSISLLLSLSVREDGGRKALGMGRREGDEKALERNGIRRCLVDL